MRYVLTILLFGALLSGVACTQQPSGGRYRDETPGGADQTAELGDVDWAGDIKPILEKNCLSCHSGKKSPDLSSYEKAKKAAKKVLAQVENGDMPPAPKKQLKQVDIDKISAWIDGGYLKEKEDDAPPQGRAAVTWKNWTAGYIKDNCASCHGKDGTPPELTSYESVKSAAAAVLDSMEDGRMPKGKRAPKTVVDKMVAWLDLGTPYDDRDLESGSADTDQGSGDDSVDDEGNDDGQGTDDGDTGTTVTYDGQIKSWIDSYCITCHGAGATAPDLSSKSSAAGAARAMLDSVEAGRMPKSGRLPEAEIAKLRAWVTGGTN